MQVLFQQPYVSPPLQVVIVNLVVRGGYVCAVGRYFFNSLTFSRLYPPFKNNFPFAILALPNLLFTISDVVVIAFIVLVKMHGITFRLR